MSEKLQRWRNFSQIWPEQINERVEPEIVYRVSLAHPCGGEILSLANQQQLDVYNANPDLFAARHFGFETTDEYREWLEFAGTPLCNVHTCFNAIGSEQLDSAEWRKLHRSAPCSVHASTAREDVDLAS